MTNVSLSKVLGEAQSHHCLQAIAQRYRLPIEQAAHVASLVRPVLLRQLEQRLSSKNGSMGLLRTLADPAFAKIERQPGAIVEQDVRLVGDAIHRQLSRQDADAWATLDQMARDSGVSHQTLRAMVPALTLMILGAIRRATAPAFLRLLMQHRPDDTGTDPFAFASEQADAPDGRTIKPETALRWLDRVLTRADPTPPDEGNISLHADPDIRIR